jgi:hypothetical protein
MKYLIVTTVFIIILNTVLCVMMPNYFSISDKLLSITTPLAWTMVATTTTILYYKERRKHEKDKTLVEQE